MFVAPDTFPGRLLQGRTCKDKSNLSLVVRLTVVGLEVTSYALRWGIERDYDVDRGGVNAFQLWDSNLCQSSHARRRLPVSQSLRHDALPFMIV
jgi:hypothetical protein